MNYRLIHDNNKVIAFIEAIGITATPFTVYEGGMDDCMDEVERLNLLDPFKHLPEIPDIVISSWQAKAILEIVGKKIEVQTYIENMENGQEKIIIQNAWENNANFSRRSKSIINLGKALGFSITELNDLFAMGSKIEV